MSAGKIQYPPKIGKIQVSYTSLSYDSVPSALIQTDVLGDYAYCDQALFLPICGVQCAPSARM